MDAADEEDDDAEEENDEGNDEGRGEGDDDEDCSGPNDVVVGASQLLLRLCWAEAFSLRGCFLRRLLRPLVVGGPAVPAEGRFDEEGGECGVESMRPWLRASKACRAKPKWCLQWKSCNESRRSWSSWYCCSSCSTAT